MSDLDRTEDPQSSNPLFAAFTMVFFVAEVFGYEGLPHVGFLVLSLVLAAAMVLTGICMYLIPDVGSTGLTDQPDEPTTAPVIQDAEAFDSTTPKASGCTVDEAFLGNPVVLKDPNPERITSEPMGDFLHGFAWEVERPDDEATRELAAAVQEFHDAVIPK